MCENNGAGPETFHGHLWDQNSEMGYNVYLSFHRSVNLW
jgi:hypothetical protein